MRQFWKWIKTHWYIPLTVVGAILGIIVGTQLQRRGSVKDAGKRVKRELKAIDASTKVAKTVAEEGKERALDVLEKTHKIEIEALDEKQAAKKKRLEKDPVALSKFLVRVARED